MPRILNTYELADWTNLLEIVGWSKNSIARNMDKVLGAYGNISPGGGWYGGFAFRLTDKRYYHVYMDQSGSVHHEDGTHILDLNLPERMDEDPKIITDWVLDIKSQS